MLVLLIILVILVALFSITSIHTNGKRYYDGGKREQNKLTYIFDCVELNGGLNHNMMSEVICDAGFVKVNYGKPVHFAQNFWECKLQRGFQKNKFNRQLATVKMGIPDIWDILIKSNLPTLFQKNNPDGMSLIPKTWKLTEFKYDGGVYIGKIPVSTHQEGVRLISSAAELEEFKEFYKGIEGSKYDESKLIVMEYVTAPLLREGRKFHMRVLLYEFVIEGCLLSKYFVESVLLANEPYKAADWQNKNIHLTGGFTMKYAIFPQDFSAAEVSKIGEGINKACEGFFRAVSPELECYPESRACLHISGMDLMFDENYNPIIIEVNVNPALYPFINIKTDEDKKLADKIQKLTYEVVVNDFLKPMFGIGESVAYYVNRAKRVGKLTPHIEILRKLIIIPLGAGKSYKFDVIYDGTKIGRIVANRTPSIVVKADVNVNINVNINIGKVKSAAIAWVTMIMENINYGFGLQKIM